MKHVCLAACLIICTLRLSAQSISITGTITDAGTGEPLYAATISAGEIGTTSDFDGKYQLDIPATTESIRVSYVGYEMVYIPVVSGTMTYDVALSTSQNILETAVVTGSKYEQSLAESVVSIDVLSPQLIKNTNTTNVEDIMGKIPGVQMIDGQPNIRAGSGWSYNAGNRVMMLIDDIPALSPDAGRASWEDVPVESISQVEVIKGAGSALYGSAAMNGVVNIRTAYATSEPETSASMVYTAYDDYSDPRKTWYRRDGYDHTPQEYALSISHRQKIGKWDVVASAYYARLDSTKSYRDRDFRSKFRSNLNVRYRISDRITAGVNSIFTSGSSSSFFLWNNNSTGALRPYAGTVTQGQSTRAYIDPHLTIYDASEGRHRLQGRLYFNDNDNNLNQSNSATMLYGEYQYQKQLWETTRLSVGLLATDVSTDSELFRNADVTQNTIATYMQVDQSIGQRLQLSGGLRYEHNKQENDAIDFDILQVDAGEQSEGQWIARLGSNYRMSEYTFVRGSIGQAYRFPILIERFLSTNFGGFVIIPNPDLKSERGVTMELGIKNGIAIGPFKGYIDLAVFDSRYSDMMEFVFTDIPVIGFQSQNIGNTRIRGWEFSIAGSMMLGAWPMSMYGGYTYSDPTYRDYDEIKEFLNRTSSLSDTNVLKYRSKHTYTMDVQLDPGSWSVGGAIRGVSAVDAIDKILSQNFGIGEYRENINKGEYLVVDARIGYELSPMIISLHAKNLTNAEYSERPALLAAPRSLALRLDVDL